MKKTFNTISLNLQLFAEGGAGSTGTGDGGTSTGSTTGESVAAAVSQSQGETAQDANVQADDTTATQVDRNAEFEKLITGDYKNEFDARVQSIVKNRLAKSKEAESKYKALTPTLEMLASKYGVDVSDVEALSKAIEEDDSYYEQEAMERGIDVKELKKMKKLERENSSLRMQMQEHQNREAADRQYQAWMQQSEAIKAIYPSFDMQTELANPKFVNLIRSNIDMRTAYEVIHKDEIMAGAMQYTAKEVEKKISQSVQANGRRPAENGVKSTSAAVVKSDVSQLSREQRQELIRRAQRGERVEL